MFKINFLLILFYLIFVSNKIQCQTISCDQYRYFSIDDTLRVKVIEASNNTPVCGHIETANFIICKLIDVYNDYDTITIISPCDTRDYKINQILKIAQNSTRTFSNQYRVMREIFRNGERTENLFGTEFPAVVVNVLLLNEITINKIARTHNIRIRPSKPIFCSMISAANLAGKKDHGTQKRFIPGNA